MKLFITISLVLFILLTIVVGIVVVTKVNLVEGGELIINFTASFFLFLSGINLVKYVDNIINWLFKITTPFWINMQKKLGYMENQIERAPSKGRMKRGKITIIIVGVIITIIGTAGLISFGFLSIRSIA